MRRRQLIYSIFSLYSCVSSLNTSKVAETIVSMNPKIVYMDGQGKWDSCLPGLKRSVNAESGMLISHGSYGTQPYNVSKNCFLTITVPLNFRVRLRVLDFDVNGDWRHCEKDTLHIFDHEETVDPVQLEQLATVERSPGRILGQFCGKFPPLPSPLRLKTATWNHGFTELNADLHKAVEHSAAMMMAESSHNALTLWWHTDTRRTTSHNGAEGFRILWSSFRLQSAKHDKCTLGKEFSCASGMECIPLSLGCNSYADCMDESDMDVKLQIQHGCEHIPADMFNQLNGFRKLLICIAIALGVAFTCFFCCFFFYLCRSRHAALLTRSSMLSGPKQQQQPQHNSKSRVAHQQQNLDILIMDKNDCASDIKNADCSQPWENRVQHARPYQYLQQKQLQQPSLIMSAEQEHAQQTTNNAIPPPLPPNFSPPQVPQHHVKQSMCSKANNENINFYLSNQQNSQPQNNCHNKQQNHCHFSTIPSPPFGDGTAQRQNAPTYPSTSNPHTSQAKLMIDESCTSTKTSTSNSLSGGTTNKEIQKNIGMHPRLQPRVQPAPMPLLTNNKASHEHHSEQRQLLI